MNGSKKLTLLLTIFINTYPMSHLARYVVTRRFYSNLYQSRWPSYSAEQAFLITDLTLRTNKLTKQDAYDWDLKDKIEEAASLVCPTHNPPQCYTCNRAQVIAFTRVSEELYKKVNSER